MRGTIDSLRAAVAISLLCCFSFIQIASWIQGNTVWRGQDTVRVSGREREGYHTVADAAVHVRDKMALMGTVMGIGRGRCTTVWAGRQFREVRSERGGQELIVIKVFNHVKSLANVQVNSYHNGECYIGWGV